MNLVVAWQEGIRHTVENSVDKKFDARKQITSLCKYRNMLHCMKIKDKDKMKTEKGLLLVCEDIKFRLKSRTTRRGRSRG